MGIYHCPSRTWIEGTSEAGKDAEGFVDDYVLSLPGRLLALGTEEDGSFSAVEVMSAAQDWAIDETGHGWPELHTDAGQFLAILQPAFDDNHAPVWSSGATTIPLGSLEEYT